MRYGPLIFSGAIFIIALAFYFGNFHGPLSSNQAVWGVFGDFLGGLLNPILSFTTVYLLIRSLTSQHEALALAKRQADDAQSALAEQRELELVKQFESSFFVFSNVAANAYDRFSIKEKGATYVSSSGISYIIENIQDLKGVGVHLGGELIAIDERNHDSIYALIQSYCSLFKVVSELCPEKYKEKYFSIAVSLMPSKVIHLMCLCEVLTAWPILKPVRDMGFFEKEAMKGLVGHFRSW